MNDERPTDPAAHGRPRDGGRIDPDRVHGIAGRADADADPGCECRRYANTVGVIHTCGLGIESVSRSLAWLDCACNRATGTVCHSHTGYAHSEGYCDPCGTDPCRHTEPLTDADWDAFDRADA